MWDRSAFEIYITDNRNLLDADVYMLLTDLACGQNVEWDPKMIREIIEFAETKLAEKGADICDPYFVEDFTATTCCWEENDCLAKKNGKCRFAQRNV